MRFIDKITNLFERSSFGSEFFSALDREDVSLNVIQSARPLMIAIEYTRRPRPMLVIVPGSDRAQITERSIASLIGREQVYFLPERSSLPWQAKADKPALIAKRAEAFYHMLKGDNCVVVTTIKALQHGIVSPRGRSCKGPNDSQFAAMIFEPFHLSYAGTIPFETVASELVKRGYERFDTLNGPGTFHISGDTLDVWPANLKHPIRAEFFGDEIDGLRSIIAATGQSICDLEAVDIYPCIEHDSFDGIDFNEDIAKAKTDFEPEADSYSYEQERYGKATLENVTLTQKSPDIPAIFFPCLCCAASATIVLMEPRALIDEGMRYLDDVTSRGRESGKISTANLGKRLEALLLSPAKFDFSAYRNLSLYSIETKDIKRANFFELAAKRPAISGQDERLFSTLRSLILAGCTIFFALPDRAHRESIMFELLDRGIVFSDCTSSGMDPSLQSFEGKFERGVVYFVDVDMGAGAIFADLKLAILSVEDLYGSEKAHRTAKKVDVTEITFPFAPGDYVVHSVHGIARFNDIVRRESSGIERDYLFLEYAAGDKLYVPVEHLERVTRYVGPDGTAPRLTRLHTSDWRRVTQKARNAAKKLAFDLVDLYARRAAVTGYRYPPDTVAQREMECDFPYEETDDQLNAIRDVKLDMESSKPMDRLICGDVGFGKTEVALRAAFKATQSDKQVMVLCPTTILAQQHFATFNDRFAPYGIKTEILSRFRSNAAQRQALEGFAAGEVNVLIGTHRLLSRDVNPKNLGLVIIDEEQRFGVGHKEQLKNLREQIDVLTLSATPIPRTLQMATSGVRDMSLINTAPASRAAVKVHVGEWDEDLVAQAIRRELGRKGQVYYVSNRVKTIEDAVSRVLTAAPEARVGVAHGQLNEKALESVMEDFAAGEIDVLVATTIIESGIDNPHTNTLIIEDSQRLGLAQLYQLKGRVGRSRTQAYAYFLFPPNASLTEQAQERLLAIDEHQELGSGIKIAMRDLEIRGAGSLVGADQHGNLSSVGFDLFTQMLSEAVNEARGQTSEPKAEVVIDIPTHMYFSEEYLPDIDKRVLWYRRFAAVEDYLDLEHFEQKLAQECGPLPDEAQNLVNRARLRILAQEMGITHISLTGSRLNFTPVDWSRNVKARSILAQSHGVYAQRANKAVLPVTSADEALVCGIEFLSKVKDAMGEA